jgi:hypothetical protein
MNLTFSNFAKSFFNVANKFLGHFRAVAGVKGLHDLGGNKNSNVTREVLKRLSHPSSILNNPNQSFDRVQFTY